MDQDEKELLERTARLAEENNKMLHSLYGSMRINRAIRIIYWILIIAVSVGSFYFLEPYLRTFESFYDNVITGGYSLKNFVK